MKDKTIKPIDLGGQAGGSSINRFSIFFLCSPTLGDKYIVNSILFKFAVDNGLYGGDDAAAAKVAGHELKVLLLHQRQRRKETEGCVEGIGELLQIRIETSLFPSGSSLGLQRFC